MLQFQEVPFISLARYRQLSQRILEDHDKNPPPPPSPDPKCCFLVKKDSESVENTCNLGKLGKSWNELNFSQPHKTDLWNKMRTAIEIKGIEILIKEFEET